MRRAVAVWLCTLLMFGSVALILDVSEETEGKVVIRNGIEYVVHAPIRINNNSDFASNATSGNGSIGNPWVIENLSIDGSVFGYCLYIGNTTDNFLIQNCELHNVSTAYPGPYAPGAVLVLNNVSHGIFINNSASRGIKGFFIDNCTNNTFINNTVNQYFGVFTGTYGIYLNNSHFNVIEGNNATSANCHGIFLMNSKFNHIIKNNISERGGGIGICQLSSDNIVENNTITLNDGNLYIYNCTKNIINNNYLKCSVYIEDCQNIILTNNEIIDFDIILRGPLLEHWNTHSIDESNTVNGKPVRYWKNRTSGTVPLDTGQIILANCTTTNVINLNNTNGTVDIVLGFSNDNLISSNQEFGVDLTWSNGNRIINNRASTNGLYGFSSNGNEVNNNIFTPLDSSYGINFVDSNHNLIDNNTVTGNTYGISVWAGPTEDYCFNYTITNNTAINSRIGISLFDSFNSIVSNNIITQNTDFGISLRDSNNNSIIRNNITSNFNTGLYLIFSNDNHIYHNSFINNSNQSFDYCLNYWDNGYPSGGNYWSDYNGTDLNSDGIGDAPYNIDNDTIDNFPLMKPWTTPLVGDIFSPMVTSTTPANASTNVSVSAPLTIEFSEPMNPYSVELAISPFPVNTTIQYNWDASNSTLSLDFSRDLSPNTEYTVTITSARDVAGNNMTANYSFSFRTWVDTDRDGIPDSVDPDDDGDGTNDEWDAFPLNPWEAEDFDGDGVGNVADPDDDNDGVLDVDDLNPFDPNIGRAVRTNWALYLAIALIIIVVIGILLTLLLRPKTPDIMTPEEELLLEDQQRAIEDEEKEHEVTEVVEEEEEVTEVYE